MKKQWAPADRYDSPWKQIIERHFPAFLAFYFPRVHEAIDWRTRPIFLEKELQQIRPDHKEGRKIVDKLVQVRLLEGAEVWLYIHIEIQVSIEKGFVRRIFVYNYRIYDKLGHEVISLVILGDDDPNWRPERFEYGRFGATTSISFLSAKLLDYRAQQDLLEREANPFAMATMAHLASRTTKGDPFSRYQWKLRLFRLLLGKGWKGNAIRDLMRFMDYMLTLPSELDNKLKDTIHSEVAEEGMEYITGWEQRAMKKGLNQGINLGQRKMFRFQLESRFGQLPDWAKDRIDKADEQTVMSWASDFYTKDSLESALKPRAKA